LAFKALTVLCDPQHKLHFNNFKNNAINLKLFSLYQLSIDTSVCPFTILKDHLSNTGLKIQHFLF